MSTVETADKAKPLAPVKVLIQSNADASKKKTDRPKYANKLANAASENVQPNGKDAAVKNEKKDGKAAVKAEKPAKPKASNSQHRPNNQQGSHQRSHQPQQPQNGERKPFRQFRALPKPEVKELPADEQYKIYEVTKDNVVYFSGPSNIFSALYPVSMTVHGHDYNSVEHYYQACKLFTLAGEEKAAMIKTAKTPIEVKQQAKQLLKGKATKKAIDEWKINDSFQILRLAITEKFSQNEELKKKLLETGDKILIQTYFGDTFFAAGANQKYTSEWVNRHTNESVKIPTNLSNKNYAYSPLIGNGKNLLGFITMEVRDAIRQETAQTTA